MFGGIGLFRSGLMFGLIVRDELYLTSRSASLTGQHEAAGEAPFSYQTRHGSHTITSYWRCPPDPLDDAETLLDWARQLIDAANTAARAKPKVARKQAARS
jgi:DNA transformation protein